MIVLDTSGLLALVDSDQQDHAAVHRAITAEPGPFLVPPFVLAELDYLLMTRLGVTAEVDVLREVAAGVYDLVPFGIEDLVEAADLIERYRDIKIGLADAAVAVVAARMRTTRLLTLDQRHFRAIKPLWGTTFTLLPADAS
jgi:predicted nucleic acid-binding protein